MNLIQSRAAILAAAVALTPGVSLACACGCSIFDIGDGTFMPNNANSGLSVWFRYSYMDQNQNWEGGSKAPASDNGDKRILTNFYTAGAQYVINRDWTVMAELPIYDRALTTTDDGSVFGPAGSVYTGHVRAMGDLELMGTYTGVSKDLSTGLSFGVKLPTGDYTGPNGPLGSAEFDRDSLPGTGSTDLIVGGYHVGSLNKSGTLSWFVQGRYQFAVMTRNQYRPGNEFDGALGVTYDLGKIGPAAHVSPVLQVVESNRLHDSGDNADPLNSGYQRVLFEPGVSMRFNKMRLFADVALPIQQHTNFAPSPAIEGTSGQLVAKTFFKMQVSYDF